MCILGDRQLDKQLPQPELVSVERPVEDHVRIAITPHRQSLLVGADSARHSPVVRAWAHRFATNTSRYEVGMLSAPDAWRNIIAMTTPSSEAPLSIFDRAAKWLGPHASMAINIAVVVGLGSLFLGDVIMKWRNGKFDYVEASFAIQTTVFLGFILIRRPSKGVDPDLRNQLIAMMAFGSGALFVTEPRTENASLLLAAKITMLASNILGLGTILNLGKNFGILIAIRGVETRGFYSIIRHPMYFTDILLRVGLVLQVPAGWNIFLAFATGALYVKRALLEEAFLSKDPAYKEYMQHVRYRFLPFIF